MLCKHRGAVAAPQVSLKPRWAAPAAFSLALVPDRVRHRARLLGPARRGDLGRAAFAGRGRGRGWTRPARLSSRALVRLQARPPRMVRARARRDRLGAARRDHRPRGDGSQSSYSVAAMDLRGGARRGCRCPARLRRNRPRPHRHGELLAIAAGLLVGVTHVAIKALTGTVPGDMTALSAPGRRHARRGGAQLRRARPRATGRRRPYRDRALQRRRKLLGDPRRSLVFGDPSARIP